MTGNAASVRRAWATRLGLSVEQYNALVAAGQKWCGGCKEWHPTSRFGQDRTRYDGLTSRCLNARARKVNGPNRRVRLRMAGHGLAWCRSCSAWLPISDIRGGACRTHRNEAARRFYARNAPAIRAQKTARMRGLDPIPPWWRAERFEDFDNLCAYGCGRQAKAIDHVWPVSRGGQSRPDNLVPACTTCNSRKKAADPSPWLTRFCIAFPDLFANFVSLNFEAAGFFDPDMMEVA